VRLCVLAPRQWRGMRAWLGEPEQFQDPVFDSIAARTKAFGELSRLMAALFADKTMAQLVAEGQSHGVPIAAVLTPAQALNSEHLTEVGALVDTELASGVTARVPVGYWVVDGSHAGYRTAAPGLGGGECHWTTDQFITKPTREVGDRPLSGVRILDLGVIVAGGELSRLFADLGAEVIKIESASYPDGLRQKRPEQQISESFARAHRNNLGLGLELRSPAGAELFSRLVSASDAVFANFKPGTLSSLGFPYERLREFNPGVVLAESSAFGDTGPWSKRLGYGPLVRATIGVTRLWTSQEPPAPTARHAFYDATTIFPDHVVGRISAIGALAALIRRERDGIGARIHVSQAEAAINQLDTLYVTLAAEASGAGRVEPDPATHLVLACSGDDEWCVVSIRSDADRRAVAAVTDGAELADWARAKSPQQAAEALQAAGVPAGPMIRASELRDDPQLTVRNVFSDMVHPLLDLPLPTEAGPAPYRHIPPAPQRPAPLPGADTRQICRDVLGMATGDVDQLISDGVLFATADDAETTGVTR
jgi:crotonobetainyl-CoA:carnitine CoA-transferase CaiB-like acyl-CoA transferase